MSTSTSQLSNFLDRDYAAGFVTELEADTVPRGLSEDTIRLISAEISSAVKAS